MKKDGWVTRIVVILMLVQAATGLIRVLGVVSSHNPIAPHGPNGVISQCSNITDDCRGGYPVVNSWFRELSKNTRGTIRLSTPDVTSRVINTHSEGIYSNYDVWKHLELDFITFRTNFPISASTDSERHEVETFLKGASIPSVLSNHQVSDTNIQLLDLIERYFIKSINGINIGVVVLWDDLFVGMTSSILKISVVLPVLTRRMREDHKADIIISYLTGNIGGSWSESRYSDIANAGVDVVICDVPYFTTDAGVVISKTETRQNTTFFFTPPGYDLTSLDINENDAGGWSFSITKINLSETVPEDHDKDLFESDSEWIQREVSKATVNPVVIGMSSGPMEKPEIDIFNKPCVERECQLGRLTTDAMLQQYSTDVALLNGGALRGNGWEAGPITKSLLLEALPFPNELCVLNLTGPSLLAVINTGLKPLLPNSTDNKFMDLGAYLQVSGLRFRYNSNLEPGQRVSSLEILNKNTLQYEAVQRRAVYSVTTIRFLVDGGDGFGNTLADHVPGSLSCKLQTLFASVDEYLKANNPYTPHLDGLIIDEPEAEALIMINKSADNCTIYERHIPYWSDCERCEEGWWHPNAGDAFCVEKMNDGDGLLLVWILAGVGVLLICIAIPISWKSTSKSRKIRQLYDNNKIAEECAAAVVELRLSDLDYLNELEKPNTIQRSFISIVEQMKLYIDFMPKALIVNVQDEMVDPLDTSVKSASAPLSLSMSNTTRDITQSTNNPLLRTTATDFSEKINYVRRKRVTMLAINCRELLKFETADTLTEKLHSGYLETFNTVISAHFGVTEAGCGDRLLAGWNTVNDKCSTTQKVCAATAAHKLSCSLLEPLHINIGLGHGEAKVGLCGSRGARKYDILGRPVTQAMYLMILNKHYGTNILLPRSVAIDCQPFFASEIIDHISYPKIGRVLLYRLGDSKVPQKEGIEWMYVLEQAETDDPYAVHNSHWVNFMATGEIPNSASVSGKLLELKNANPSGTIENYAAPHLPLSFM
eukprot:TRINITY_DN18781_c0_g1_i1.p1 TRINITY_DN18781_c0_g1~~TRINITY_DN18781_c0_g1_i1.p1  ORF type:complete len:996 (+),score=186.74 TRINITY_DN18781_c0_g1_i1:41-3028(+)